jgi:predicted transcriptional regulator
MSARSGTSRQGDKAQTEQAVLDFIRRQGEASVDQVVAGVGIGRTSARKYLVGLMAAGQVKRGPGGREGGRKRPDRFSVAKRRRASAPRKATKRSGRRLRPGELDGLVLGYMRKQAEDRPLTATAIAKGIERSSGAVANCLARLAGKGAVRQAKVRPRAYVTAKAGTDE